MRTCLSHVTHHQWAQVRPMRYSPRIFHRHLLASVSACFTCSLHRNTSKLRCHQGVQTPLLLLSDPLLSLSYYKTIVISSISPHCILSNGALLWTNHDCCTYSNNTNHKQSIQNILSGVSNFCLSVNSTRLYPKSRLRLYFLFNFRFQCYCL